MARQILAKRLYCDSNGNDEVRHLFRKFSKKLIRMQVSASTVHRVGGRPAHKLPSTRLIMRGYDE
jgi:hypothetical protein